MNKLSVILLILLIVYACDKKDCTGKTTISYSLMDEFGEAGCGLDTSGLATAGLNYVVVDSVTLDNLLACDELPSINFDSYTLLIGSYLSDTDLSYREQAVIRDCGTGIVTYQISFNSVGTDTSMQVDYHAVIPKVPEDYVIDFAIRIWQEQ